MCGVFGRYESGDLVDAGGELAGGVVILTYPPVRDGKEGLVVAGGTRKGRVA